MARPRKAAKKARKTRRTKTKVIADLPLHVNLTKRNSANDLRFTVKTGRELLGTLQMGRGSVRWYAANAKKPTGKWNWKDFARLLADKRSR